MRKISIGTCVNQKTYFPYCFLCDNKDEYLLFDSHMSNISEWGNPIEFQYIERKEVPAYSSFFSMWKIDDEEESYIFHVNLPIDYIKERLNEVYCNQFLFDGFVIGIAEKGMIVIWIYGEKKSIILTCDKGTIASELYNYYIKNLSEDNLIEINILQPSIKSISSKQMQQYCYRYNSLFEHWDENQQIWYSLDDIIDNLPELDYIEQSLYDGTHDKMHDGGLMNYHQAGKPKKLSVSWHVNKSEYTAYFWFEDEAIRYVFDRFYGAHPDTKTDFIIRIDSDKNKYELALYRYGLKEPQVIIETAYQLLVFKNKFEYYRSNNYNQPHGAWIW